jgi:hypothetical protein
MSKYRSFFTRLLLTNLLRVYLILRECALTLRIHATILIEVSALLTLSL